MKVKKVYNPHDEISRFYNSLFNFPQHFDKELVAGLAMILEKRGGRTILDMGCGSGNPSIGLSLAGYDVTAMDTSPCMLDLAQSNACEVGASLGFWFCAMEEARKLGKTYDFVICHDSLYYFDTLDKFVKLFASIRRDLLAPGGCLYIATKIWDKETDREQRSRLEMRGAIPLDGQKNLIVFDVLENDRLTVFLVEENAARIQSTSVEFGWYPRNPVLIRELLLEAEFCTVETVLQAEEAKYSCEGILAY